ncbi:MAG: GFA family protein [Pleurocapsa sp.]
MTKKQESAIYQGSCHCGAVRFQVLVDRFIVEDCNCSICRKKGFLHLIVSPENFTLVKGEELLTTYTFNIRTLDENVLDRFEIRSFDGVNWEENVDKIRQ